MYFYYSYNVLTYNTANGVSPFVSTSHSATAKGVASVLFRSFSSDSKNSSSNDSTLDLGKVRPGLIFNNIIISVSAVQKNLASAKRQLKALNIYSPEEIRANSALRLKAAQLELTLKHIFEESTMAFSKNELEELLKMLESVK